MDPKWGAVIVALALPIFVLPAIRYVYKWFNRPILHIRAASPHTAVFRYRDKLSNQVETVWYVRLQVHNYGRTPAREVVVTLSALSLFESPNILHPSFFPLDLHWADPDTQCTPAINPNTFQYIDIGYFAPKGNTLPPEPSRENSTFIFRTFVRFSNQTNEVAPGTYNFTLIASAANVKPKSIKFTIKISDNWENLGSPPPSDLITIT